MKLIIVRHGETADNAKNIRMGHLDGKLSEAGLEQAKKLGLRFKDEKIDFIYSSDLGRTKETVSEILKYRQAPVVYDPLLRERCCGEYDGKPGVELREAAKASGLGFGFRPQGGENMYDVRNRVNKFIKYLLENHEENETILACTHGGWKGAFLSYILKIPFSNELFSIKFDNTSVSIFKLDKNKKHRVKVINCTKHLN